MKELFPIIIKVITDIKVIATMIVMLLVIEFAKYITTYKKRPPRPKKVKEKPAPAPKAEKKEEEPAEEAEE